MHAIQMELAQSTYIAAEAPPWTSIPTARRELREHLGAILETLAALAPDLGASHDRPAPATSATSTRRPAPRSPPSPG